MANWIVMNVTVGSVHFKVVDENGEVAYSGSEPVNPDTLLEAERAGVRAMGSATLWASANGGIEGFDLLG